MAAATKAAPQPEPALDDEEQSDDFVSCQGDERVIQLPARRPLLAVDRWLGRDPVTFLGHCRKEQRERTAITISASRTTTASADTLRSS